MKPAGLQIEGIVKRFGSQLAVEYYAQVAIDAKVAFVNALPVFIAGTKEWSCANHSREIGT